MNPEKDIQSENQFENNEHVDNSLTDHEYDGIKELDNPPPTWIMAIFFITILFSLLYAAHYFWFGQGESQDKEYITQVNEYTLEFEKNKQKTGELVLLKDEVSLTEGESIFNEMNCFACHGKSGEGNAVGPNLVDDFWIHGCDFNSVFNIIKNGNPAKGMTPFKAQLSDTKIQKVTSFVLLKLKGSNPENPKAAQGVECK